MEFIHQHTSVHKREVFRSMTRISKAYNRFSVAFPTLPPSRRTVFFHFIRAGAVLFPLTILLFYRNTAQTFIKSSSHTRSHGDREFARDHEIRAPIPEAFREHRLFQSRTRQPHRPLQHVTNQSKIKTESGKIPDPVRSNHLYEITVSNSY